MWSETLCATLTANASGCFLPGCTVPSQGVCLQSCSDHFRKTRYFMHSHLKERLLIPWWLKTSSTNALFGQNSNISCDQCWMSEQLMALGEQSLKTLSEATDWCKRLLNYSLGFINKFPDHLGGSYPSWFTSTSIYGTISSSVDSGSGKLSTLLFQPDMPLGGSNACVLWQHSGKMHYTKGNCSQDSGRFSSPGHSFHLHLNNILVPTTPWQPSRPLTEAIPAEALLQHHYREISLPLPASSSLETTKKAEELYKSTYSRRTKHLATELTPKETRNITPVRILNYRRLTITIRRCSKSFLQYQMDLAINSQAQVITAGLVPTV